MPKSGWGKNILHSKTYKIVILCVWLIILGIGLLSCDRFSVESGLQASPQNMLLAALFLLLLFALKSLSVFIYCGILFIASGIIFPLNLCVAVSTVKITDHQHPDVIETEYTGIRECE